MFLRPDFIGAWLHWAGRTEKICDRPALCVIVGNSRSRARQARSAQSDLRYYILSKTATSPKASSCAALRVAGSIVLQLN